MKCPYCSSTQGRCATTSTGRSITECASCGRVVEERQFQNHHLFHLRAQDNPLCLVTSDLPSLPKQIHENDAAVDEDPFHPTGFITAFSTWSLEHTPVFLRSSLPFSGHLAELERIFELIASAHAFASASVAVDNLRAYMQIIDVASILGLDRDISDHAFQLFRDCCSATCLRNRSVEALATAALVQAIREAQEPRTLQEISIAANVPQKEIGKYIKILGEALQLSQPINSNSIAVHMPRFCTLLQLNKTAQELATHIGEVVINKCFCTRRNPISISAAAIYLACQLEDKRKTQAEICKVTGLTEVTLRKVYKELLENWDDLLPSNYTPAVPPEKAFPTTAISSGRTPAVKVESSEVSSIDKGKQPENKSIKPNEVAEAEVNDDANGAHTFKLNRPNPFSQPWLRFTASSVRTAGEKSQSVARGGINDVQFNCQDLLPSKYTPAVPQEKVFPGTAITSGCSPAVKVNSSEVTSLNKDKQPETKSIKSNEGREAETNDDANGAHTSKLKRQNPFSQPLPHFTASNARRAGEKGHCVIYGAINEVLSDHQDLLSSNHTPSIPLEKAFPVAAYTSGRTPAVKASLSEVTSLDKDKQLETQSIKLNETTEAESDDDASGSHSSFKMNLQYPIGRPWLHFTPSTISTAGEKNQSIVLGGINDRQSDRKDLLTSNFTPSAPPDNVCPTATFGSGRIPAVKADLGEVTSLDKEKQPETKSIMGNEVTEAETNNDAYGGHSSFKLNQQYPFGQPWFRFLPFTIGMDEENSQTATQGAINEVHSDSQDLLPPNFTPAIPLEKAFPTAAITSGCEPAKVYSGEISSLEKDKQPETMIIKRNEVTEAETKVDPNGAHTFYKSKQSYAFDQPWPRPFNIRTAEENNQNFLRDLDQKVDEDSNLAATSSVRPSQFPGHPISNVSSFAWPFLPSPSVATASVNIVHPPKLQPGHVELNRTGIQAKVKNANQCEE